MSKGEKFHSDWIAFELNFPPFYKCFVGLAEIFSHEMILKQTQMKNFCVNYKINQNKNHFQKKKSKRIFAWLAGQKTKTFRSDERTQVNYNINKITARHNFWIQLMMMWLQHHYHNQLDITVYQKSETTHLARFSGGTLLG